MRVRPVLRSGPLSGVLCPANRMKVTLTPTHRMGEGEQVQRRVLILPRRLESPTFSLLDFHLAGQQTDAWIGGRKLKLCGDDDMNENVSEAPGFNRRDFLKGGSSATLMTLL